MKYGLFCAVLAISLFAGSALHAQKPAGRMNARDKEFVKALEDTLIMFSHIIVNDSLEEERFGATRLMIPTLVKALKMPNSFNYPFDRLNAVSIQYAPDSTFRVFTWQLFVNDEEYRYYGAIQMNATDLKLFPLVDRSFNIEDPAQAVTGPENWYGALYYNIRKLSTPQGPAYLMFGYEMYSFFKRRKLIEVLMFKDGKPVFGHSVFPATVNNPTPVKRLILEYTAEASVKLNYDEALGLIVFDHLIPVPARYGEGEIMGPDGSYEAFRIKPNGLEYISMLDTQILDEPPRPSPVLGDKSKDILGRPVKKN